MTSPSTSICRASVTKSARSLLLLLQLKLWHRLLLLDKARPRLKLLPRLLPWLETSAVIN